jgi:hypothetical protein
MIRWGIGVSVLNERQLDPGEPADPIKGFVIKSFSSFLPSERTLNQ